jgi:ankyrin repeat protein
MADSSPLKRKRDTADVEKSDGVGSPSSKRQCVAGDDTAVCPQEADAQLPSSALACVLRSGFAENPFPLARSCKALYEDASLWELFINKPVQEDGRQHKRTPLMAASYFCRSDRLKWLLQGCKADPNRLDAQGKRAINCCLENADFDGQMQVIQALLLSGATLSEPRDFSHPLLAALQTKQEKASLWLLDYLLLHVPNALEPEFIQVVLAAACERGMEPFVASLLARLEAAGFSSKLQYVVVEEIRHPLDIACEKGLVSAVTLLLEYYEPTEETLRAACGFAVETKDKVLAADMIKAVLSAGAKVASEAASLMCQFGVAPVLRVLLESDASVLSKRSSISCDLNLLHVAASKGHADVVRELLKYQAYVRHLCLSEDHLGRTPLTLACEGAHDAAVDALLEASGGHCSIDEAAFKAACRQRNDRAFPERILKRLDVNSRFKLNWLDTFGLTCQARNYLFASTLIEQAQVYSSDFKVDSYLLQLLRLEGSLVSDMMDDFHVLVGKLLSLGATPPSNAVAGLCELYRVPEKAVVALLQKGAKAAKVLSRKMSNHFLDATLSEDGAELLHSMVDKSQSLVSL